MPSDPHQEGLALVIGGTGSLGQSIVRLASRGGWEVLATGRNLPPNELRADAHWVEFDHSRSETVRALVDEVDVRQPLRAIFFCVGTPSSKRHIAETDLEEFERLYRDNVVSLVAAWRALAPAARRGAASLLALGSDATAGLHSGNGAYAATKVALEALVTTLAREEAAHGVRANVLSPSLVRSPMAETVIALKGVYDSEVYYHGLPWGRPLEPDEVAQAAIDIALSEHWRYASGQVFRMAVRGDG